MITTDSQIGALRAEQRALGEEIAELEKSLVSLGLSLGLSMKPEKKRPTRNIAKANKTQPNNKRGGFRSNTPINLTGTDRITWFSEEIDGINDLNGSFKILFDEYDSGGLDKNRVLVTLVLAKEHLRRYLCNLADQLQVEEHHQAEQAQQARGRIVLLADFCRNHDQVNPKRTRLSEKTVSINSSSTGGGYV